MSGVIVVDVIDHLMVHSQVLFSLSSLKIILSWAWLLLVLDCCMQGGIKNKALNAWTFSGLWKTDFLCVDRFCLVAENIVSYTSDYFKVGMPDCWNTNGKHCFTWRNSPEKHFKVWHKLSQENVHDFMPTNLLAWAQCRKISCINM